MGITFFMLIFVFNIAGKVDLNGFRNVPTFEKVFD